jgi:hypothetical protein
MTRQDETQPAVTFSYELTGSGWAHGNFTIGDQHISLPASYVSDGLRDLLLAVSALANGADEAFVTWSEEPGCHELQFNSVSGRCHLRIRYFPDLWPKGDRESGVIQFDIDCNLGEFCRAVATGVREFFDEIGAEAYENQWHLHPFPAAELARLEQQVQT